MTTDAESRAELAKHRERSEQDRKVLDAAIQQARETGCFVAGTRIHTKEGLKPIEQMRVGDLVLSRHESGQGELCYQPVTRIYRYEDRELYFVAWQVLEPGTNRPTDVGGHLVVTGAHPLWIKRLMDHPLSEAGVSEQVVAIDQWMSVEEIYLRRWNNYWNQLGGTVDPYVELIDGQRALITFIDPLLQSDDPDIGVGFSDREGWEDDQLGIEVRIEQGDPHIAFGSSGGIPKQKYLGNVDRDAYDYDGYDTESGMSLVKRSGGFLPLRRPVFNLEVAGTHTYFVTALGLWVHNISGVIENRTVGETAITDSGVIRIAGKTNVLVDGQVVFTPSRRGLDDPVRTSLVRRVLRDALHDRRRYALPTQAGGCFIKGTRVHTREGLKRIEEIKAGDYVLSSPEDGSGKPEYKRVVNTFVHTQKTIVDLYVSGPDAQTQFFFGATGNHPFWVEGVGWTRADTLKKGDVVRKADGTSGKVASNHPVYRTDREGVGWTPMVLTSIRTSYGTLFDYENNEVIPTNAKTKYLPADIYDSENPYLEVTVYNLEVEDFHTYYVGSEGIWVHNANCEGVKLANDAGGELPPFEEPEGETSRGSRWTAPVRLWWVGAI